MPEETEVKLKINDVEEIKTCVLNLNGELFKKRHLEIDEYFDNNHKLQETNQVLRLRDKKVLTYKGPKKNNEKFKICEEVETIVNDGNNMTYILAKLGYTPTKRKEKYRTTFVLGKTTIALDETPMGTFVELEGRKEDIVRTAKKLGFSEKDFITETYTDLWHAHAKKYDIKGDMVFNNVSY